MLPLLGFAIAASAEMYCPTQNDFTYGGNIQWSQDYGTGTSGWTMTSSGGVHGKQTYNLLCGYVQFDMDTSRAHRGVNNNFYTSSPERSIFPNYCDIQENGNPQCMEMDIVENNGNCYSQTTWHTWPNHNGDCDEGGCWGGAWASGKRTVKAEFSCDGWMTVSMNGNQIWVTNPTPSNNAKNYVAQQMKSLGVMFHSTQWVGWVPQGGSCGDHGDANGSTFTVSNVIVSGTVVQGSEPNKCRSEQIEHLLTESVFRKPTNSTNPLNWDRSRAPVQA